MNSLQQHQRDLQAIASILAAIEQAPTAGTPAMQAVIKDTIASFQMQKRMSELCIQDITEGELRPRDWQSAIEYFHSDGGIYTEEMAA